MLPTPPKPRTNTQREIEAAIVDDLVLADAGHWIIPERKSAKLPHSIGFRFGLGEQVWLTRWGAGIGNRGVHAYRINYCRDDKCPGWRGYRGVWCPHCEITSK